MNDQMFALLKRRSELLARIATQREQVAELGAHLETPLVFADKGLAAVRFLRSAPVVSAVLVASFSESTPNTGWFGEGCLAAVEGIPQAQCI